MPCLCFSEAEAGLRDLERQIQEKVNSERRENQLAPLIWNEELALEARRHAKNMAERHFFSHEDPKRGEISRRLDSSGIEWNRCAENLYKEKDVPNPAEDAVKSWLQSPGHRRNMLDSGLAETGIGVANADDGTIYVVQVFIKRFIVLKTQTPSHKFR
jgi:uncharacterized protein YkwD